MDTSRIESLAREIAAREAGRAGSRAAAQRLAEELHAEVTAAVERFAATLRESGAPHLDLITVGQVEPDDKSIRAFQVKVCRGRWIGLIVTKDRGEIMLVGPFQRGADEGPCNPVLFAEGEPALEKARGPLERLLMSLIEASYRK